MVKLMSREFTGYLLAELPECTQQKIYEKWDFSDTVIFTDFHADFLHLCGFYKPELHYSIGFSQSDYASFSCDKFSYEKGFVSKVKREFVNTDLHNFAQRLQWIYAKTFYKMQGKIVTRGYYEQSQVDFYYSYEFLHVEDELNAWLKDYSRWLLKDLQDEVLHQTSFESFAESCELNEYYFTDGGVLL